MAEMLTMQIANEYSNRARELLDNGLQDVGERRKLRIELQERCRLTELQAVNILNGYYARDYIAMCERREENERREQNNQDN
ncbi:MAG: hypothetical protein Q4C77_03825 [Eubacteriales bacterium]|nr:hypothetical protein [Eubacteriales bacterium]